MSGEFGSGASRESWTGFARQSQDRKCRSGKVVSAVIPPRPDGKTGEPVPPGTPPFGGDRSFPKKRAVQFQRSEERSTNAGPGSDNTFPLPFRARRPRAAFRPIQGDPRGKPRARDRRWSECRPDAVEAPRHRDATRPLPPPGECYLSQRGSQKDGNLQSRRSSVNRRKLEARPASRGVGAKKGKALRRSVTSKSR